MKRILSNEMWKNLGQRQHQYRARNTWWARRFGESRLLFIWYLAEKTTPPNGR